MLTATLNLLPGLQLRRPAGPLSRRRRQLTSLAIRDWSSRNIRRLPRFGSPRTAPTLPPLKTDADDTTRRQSNLERNRRPAADMVGMGLPAREARRGGPRLDRPSWDRRDRLRRRRHLGLHRRDRQFRPSRTAAASRHSDDGHRVLPVRMLARRPPPAGGAVRA